MTGFFGPLTPTSTVSAPGDEEDVANAQKRQMDVDHPPTDNGPAPKRARLINGYDNSSGGNNAFEPTPMELDDDQSQGQNQNQNQNQNANQNQMQIQNGNENAYPSPEQAPSPMVVATVGPEQGIQVDKVTELSTETTFLELADDQDADASASASARNAVPVLLQCEWNPRDPTLLAAAGTDALARMWTLPASTASPGLESDPGPDPDAQRNLKPVFQPYQNLLPASAPPTTTVTGLAWSSDGASLAVSSEPLDDGTAKIDYWTVAGTPSASFNSFESPVICLRWNPSNTACLSLSPEDGGRGTVVTIMYPSTELSYEHVLPRHSLHEQLLDVAWTTNDEFILCGGDLLQGFHCVDGGISPTRKYETREGHLLSKISFDWRSQLLATASDTGTIDV